MFWMIVSGRIFHMHDIWNPWHGCTRVSEGCQNCYMYYLDEKRDMDGSVIFRTGSFQYPLEKKRDGSYKIQSGEMVRVSMTSDFFLEEADQWRPAAWDMMKRRSDVIFYLLTKRPERVKECLPEDWGEGWENIFFNVTAENQKRADERVPILLELPFKHKGVMCAPFIGEVTLEKYLVSGQIEQVVCGGENYGGARPCRFEWVTRMYEECVRADVTFAFIETGTVFIKDGKTYHIPGKGLQSKMAYRSGMRHEGKPMEFKLCDFFGDPIPKEQLYVKRYRENCEECGSRLICNGCADCGRCGLKKAK